MITALLLASLATNLVLGATLVVLRASLREVGSATRRAHDELAVTREAIDRAVAERDEARQAAGAWQQLYQRKHEAPSLLPRDWTAKKRGTA
jgi:hypothetical protein